MKVGSLTAPLLLLVPAAQGFTAPSHFQSPAPASSRHNRSTYSYSRLSLSKAPTSTSNPYTSPQLDVDALTKYSIATLTELSLFTATFASLDFVSSTLLHLNPSSLPKVLVSFLFYAISLKSRVFNPLNNERPDRSKARNEEGSNGFRDRVMPSWTPVRNRLLSAFERLNIIFYIDPSCTVVKKMYCHSFIARRCLSHHVVAHHRTHPCLFSFIDYFYHQYLFVIAHHGIHFTSDYW